MNAIILAAGKGARLNGTAGDLPKCLVRIGDLSLIERQIKCLRAAGIDNITAVVGYGAEAVRNACRSQIEYVENPIHFRTNSLYSLWLARHKFSDGFVVLNSDVLFHPQLLTDLLTSKAEDALLLAHNDPSTELGDEEMKVMVSHGRVVDISKSMDPRRADGENVGIVKFGQTGAKLLSLHLDLLIARGHFRAWAPRAFRDFAEHRALHVVGTRGLPWIEIDFPSDYQRAVNDILPRIQPAIKPPGESRKLAAIVSARRP